MPCLYSFSLRGRVVRVALAGKNVAAFFSGGFISDNDKCLNYFNEFSLKSS